MWRGWADERAETPNTCQHWQSPPGRGQSARKARVNLGGAWEAGRGWTFEVTSVLRSAAALPTLRVLPLSSVQVRSRVHPPPPPPSGFSALPPGASRRLPPHRPPPSRPPPQPPPRTSHIAAKHNRQVYVQCVVARLLHPSWSQEGADHLSPSYRIHVRVVGTTTSLRLRRKTSDEMRSDAKHSGIRNSDETRYGGRRLESVAYVSLRGS